MADPSTTPTTKESNHHPSQIENPDPNPNPNPKPNPNPNHLDSQPDSTQPPSSTTTTQQLPPPPTINPSSAPPHISPYGYRPPMGSSAAAVVPPGAPSFRPAGAPAPIPVPQFTPIPPNPNLLAYQTQPPGVSSPAQMYPGLLPNPALRPPYMAMANGYMAPVPQGTMPPPVS